MILIWLTFCNVSAVCGLSYEQLCIHSPPPLFGLRMQDRTQKSEKQRSLDYKRFLESWSYNYLASDHVVVSQKPVKWVNGNYVDNAWELSFLWKITGWPDQPLNKQHKTAGFTHLTRKPGLPHSNPSVRRPNSHVVTCFFSFSRLLLITDLKTPKNTTTLVKIGISLIGETFSRWRC